MTTVRTPWATRTFGFGIVHLEGSVPATELVLPGLRRNPRRAHLLVSTVLGKHIAVSPDLVIEGGHRLADRVRQSIHDGDMDVLGMAETATSLGHCVADELDAAWYLHTTRRQVTQDRVYARFQEGHSHATDHTLQPYAPGLFHHDRPLVLVDDEISTGTTALAAIEAMHRLQPRTRYVVAALVDVRTDAHRAAADRMSGTLGAPIDFVSLATGRVSIPLGMNEAVNSLPPPKLNVPGLRRGHANRIFAEWPEDVPEGGRHGFLRGDRKPFDHAVGAVTTRIAANLDSARPVLIVGHEELMYLPLRIGAALASRGFDTRFQTTTRSPAYVHDDPRYPLRTGFTFSASEPEEDAARYLYNGWPGAQLVLVVDASAATPRMDEDGGVIDVLTSAGYDVLAVVVDGPDADTLSLRR